MFRNRRLFLALLLLVAIIAVLTLRVETGIEQGSILTVNLRGDFKEARPVVSVLSADPRPTLPRMISELAKAERDERLAAVVLRIGPLEMGWGKAQELRGAITRLREAGRHPVAYLEVESLTANLEYYVASAADEIYAAPGSNSPLIGLAAEYLFLGGLWEKLGVGIEVERIGRYKSFAEDLTGRAMSEPYREMANSMLDSIEGQFVEGVAARRGLEPHQVRSIIDSAPMTPAELEALGLIDGIAFFDEVVEAQGDGPVVDEEVYAEVDASGVGFEPVATFALVQSAGPVVMGEGHVSPTGGSIIAAGTVAEALLGAAEDERFSAILLRVDSGGGSALASDLIWRATREARLEKPVIVSFSDVAASGGYYMAAGANAIVSHPGTITGSIGVFILRPNFAEAFGRLGIGFDSLTRGKHADLLLGTRALSPGTRERLAASVADTYQRFLERVAEGRGLTVEEVDAVGQGRVWTGEQAHARGLVDELGGFREAVLRAKKEVGLDPGDDVALSPYPPPTPLLMQLLQALGDFNASVHPAVSVLPRSMKRLLDWVATAPAGGPVLLPPVVVDIR